VPLNQSVQNRGISRKMKPLPS